MKITLKTPSSTRIWPQLCRALAKNQQFSRKGDENPLISLLKQNVDLNSIFFLKFSAPYILCQLLLIMSSLHCVASLLHNLFLKWCYFETEIFLGVVANVWGNFNFGLCWYFDQVGTDSYLPHDFLVQSNNGSPSLLQK